MTDRQDIFQDYLLGDRMGDLEESLKESIRVSCDQQTYPAAGTILWSDGREMAMDRGDCHTLVISGTGGGKTVSQVMPALRASIKVGESLFVTDVKGGELYEQAWPYLKQQGYRVLVVNLRHPLRGIRYKPLALPFQLLRLRKPELQALGHLLLGSVPRGVALLALYAIILLVRILLETRLMASQAGLPPLSESSARMVFTTGEASYFSRS